MAIGTALGFSNLATIVARGRPRLPLRLRADQPAAAARRPGARRRDPDRPRLRHAQHRDDGDRRQPDHASSSRARWTPGLGTLLFWGSLAFALVVAGVVAVPVNRWLIARGKGHAVVHETGIHGGPPVRAGRDRRRGRLRLRQRRPDRRGDRLMATAARRATRGYRADKEALLRRLRRIEGQVRGRRADGRGGALLHRRRHPDHRDRGGARQGRPRPARGPRPALRDRRRGRRQEERTTELMAAVKRLLRHG